MHSTHDPSAPEALDPLALDAAMQGHLESRCRQQLSAMIDGALPPDEARFLLRRLQHDQELAGCWERWQLCGDLLRGSDPALLPRDFASRITGAIAREASMPVALVAAGAERATAAPRTRWHGWAGGAALAASVAVVALFVGGQVEESATPVASSATLIAASPLPGIGEAAPSIAPSNQEQPGSTANTAGAAAAALALAATASTRRARPAPAAASVTNRSASAQLEAASLAASPSEPAASTLPIAAASVQDEAAYEADARSRLVALGIGGSGPDAASTTLAHPAGAPATERPWPRAVLPGGFSSTLNAAYTQPPQADEGQAGFDAFQPQPADATAVPATP